MTKPKTRTIQRWGIEFVELGRKSRNLSSMLYDSRRNAQLCLSVHESFYRDRKPKIVKVALTWTPPKRKA